MADYRGAASEAKRAMVLIRKREKEKEEMEMKKQKITDEAAAAADIKNKFASYYDVFEEQLKDSTVGLISLDEMKAKQTQIIKDKESELISKAVVDTSTFKSPEPGFYTAPPTGSLSFAFDDEEKDSEDEDEESSEKVDVSKFKKFKKNPNVDTSFLPDAARDEQEAELRESLKQDWLQRQQRIKDQVLKIEYSYWDGSGHKREMLVKKGVTIHQFLFKCLEQLRAEGQFPELRSVGVDQLMFIKDDLILPHHSSFYDLTIMKARCRNGNLIFPPSDKPSSSSSELAASSAHTSKSSISTSPDKESAKVERVDNAKVALRNWYDKHKHIYPASRWNAFDPEKVSEPQ